jgi:hypothetical protein
VKHPALVRKCHRLDELANNRQPILHRELLVCRVGQVLLQRDLIGVVVEDEHRPTLVFGVLQGLSDAGMFERLKQLELPASGSLRSRSLLGGGVEFQRINPKPAVKVQRLMGAQEVLIRDAGGGVALDILKQLGQPIVADLSPTRPFPNPDLVDGPYQSLDNLALDSVPGTTG